MEWAIVATLAGAVSSLKFFPDLTTKKKVYCVSTAAFCGVFLSSLAEHIVGIKDPTPQLHASVIFVCAVFGQLVIGLLYKYLEKGDWIARYGGKNA